MKIVSAMAFLVLLAIQTHAAGIRFYGDIMLSRGIEKYASNQGEELLRQSLSVFLVKDAIHVINLEGSMSGNEVRKRDPSLSFFIKPQFMNILEGFQVVSLENNHSFDAGSGTRQNTVQKALSMGITALEGRNNSTIIETASGNIGIVAATDVLNDNADRLNVYLADSPEFLNEIRRIKELCTAVFVYIHWGRELLPVATDRMQMLAKSYIDAGANVVVGTHPHVVGPVSSIGGRPIVYSLGNFLFDQKYPDTKKGAILDCEIGDDGILQCSLSSCETAMNSYLPYPSANPDLYEKNRTLSNSVQTVRRTWTGRFTGDGREKSLVLDEKKGAKGLWQIGIKDIVNKKQEELTPPMPIRKLQPVDLNNDGIKEIMLLQSIYSKFDKEKAKRVYIYSFNTGFHALWRGTALCRPLIDAVFFSPKNGPPLLVALHSRDSFVIRDPKCKKRIVTVYKWNGFGFSGINNIEIEDECDAISFFSNEIRVSKKGNTIRIILENQLSCDSTF